MLFVTNYSFKPHMTKAEGRELMEAFAAAGSAPGTLSHYVNADGSGGTVIAENDDPQGAYRNALEYTEWLTFETKVVLDINEAVSQIGDYLE